MHGVVVAPRTRAGLDLFHQGVRALAVVERNGFKLDLDHFAKMKAKLAAEVADIEKSLMAHKPVWGPWRRRYGAAASFDAPDQLSKVLFDVLGVDYPADGGRTATGRRKADESVFERVEGDHADFCKMYLRRKKLTKILSTNVHGIVREAVGDVLHPTFHLHVTDSFRSSATEPNSTNLPSRNKEAARIVKTGFIPHHPDWHFAELDYVGLEVHTMYTYHHDPVMYKYLTDPGTDMHRDMAAQLYMLDPKQVSKDARYAAKNKFVFPAFYGSYYPDMAKALWDYVVRQGVTLADSDLTVIQHLKKKGVRARGACDPSGTDGGPKPGTFEAHVRDVENDFWNNRFKVYGRWKKAWHKAYLENGYFDSHTGFRYSGIFRRNQVLNLANQGSAFHCLLMTLILMQKSIHKYKWKTLIVGEIHDSMLLNIPRDEIQDVLHEAKVIMTERIPKLWKWIDIPLKIEAEISPPGKSWADKEVWAEDRWGVWGPKT